MTILITGCRSGFGLLAAAEAARAGHVVYAGLRDLDTAADLEAACEGLSVTPVQLDVTDAAQREAVVARMIEETGRIDAVVNNAGVALGGFQEQVDEDEVRKVFEVNVFAVWALNRLILPHMRAQQSGTIVQISSISGLMALPGLGVYAGSKFALEGMSEALRHEMKPFGVRVCLIEPGPYKTDILGRNRVLSRNARDPESPYAAYIVKAEELFDKIAESGAGDPVEVAKKIVQVVESSDPPLRVPMGSSARGRAMLKRLAPWGLIEFAIGRATTP